MEPNGAPSEEAARDNSEQSREFFEANTLRVHVVQAGETLYSIAWRHELDLRDLTSWNSLQNPDLILVGQKLFLTPGVAAAGSLTTEAPSAPPVADAVSADASVTGSVAERSPVPLEAVSHWRWPIRGPVVSPYGVSAGTGSGIGIGGTIGADIRSTAQGQVVYAGGGLAAYGNLIIVKHNDTFLSAYGHNDRLLVAEGEQVAPGQVIARMGLGPERIPQLHFEIRRNGKSVNPFDLLPK